MLNNALNNSINTSFSHNAGANVRVPAVIESVRYELNGIQYSGEGKNLSRVGMFILTREPLPENELLEVGFELPGTYETISCKAEVVWKRRYLEGAFYEPGMGLRFINMDRSIGDKIEEYVKPDSYRTANH